MRLNAFGHIDDLTVGATLARLIDEAPLTATTPTMACDPDQGCVLPTDTIPTKETHR
ncbi:MAG: hypothetical protein Q8K63_07865 [Acidimicrobiales bacterium]|nr:hypothetical protein [Acidimicrobiales bacterium]